MSTPNINCILQAVVAITNNLVSPPPQIATFDFGNPTLGAKVIFFEPYLQAAPLPTGTTITLPLASVFVLMIQNLNPVGGAGLNLSFTPSGQPTTNMNLGPTGIFIFIDPTETGVPITFLAVGGVGGVVPAMILAGG